MTEKDKTLLLLRVASAVSLLACATSSIERRGGSPYAPVNEQRGGSLKYLEYSRTRESLYQEMYQYCRGPYEIANERTEVVSTDTHVYRNQISTSNTRMNIIDFRCVARAPEPAPAPAALATVAGEDRDVAGQWVANQTRCPGTTVDGEVAPTAPGVRTFALTACGQRWLCNVANRLASCAPQTPTVAAPVPPPPPPAW